MKEICIALAETEEIPVRFDPMLLQRLSATYFTRCTGDIDLGVLLVTSLRYVNRFGSNLEANVLQKGCILEQVLIQYCTRFRHTFENGSTLISWSLGRMGDLLSNENLVRTNQKQSGEPNGGI